MGCLGILCSTYTLRPVPPDPRGVNRLGAGVGRQPSVHSADINEPAAETASEDRWNTAVSSRCTTPVRLQCQHHGHRRPAGRMRRASAKPNRLARSILRSRGRGLKALCCLMTSESFGCHDISRHRLSVCLPDGRAAASVCRRGAGPVAVVVAVVVWVHCTRGGCYWTRVGCALGRWGLRAVRTTLGQWIPTLVEQADSRRDRRRVIASRPPAQTAVRERCRRTCDGGAGPCRKEPGLTPARPGVHSADINEPGVSAPSRDR